MFFEVGVGGPAGLQNALSAKGTNPSNYEGATFSVLLKCEIGRLEASSGQGAHLKCEYGTLAPKFTPQVFTFAA